MIKKLFKNKILLCLLVLIFWLVPVTISIPDQSSTEVIITAIAIDKDKDEYEVTLQYILPTAPNNSENLKTTSQKDKSVHKAIEKLNFQLGKYSGIAHCRFLVFNEEASKDNLTNILDSFIRQKTNSNNIVLLCATKSAKEVLETSKNLDSNLYSFLNNTAFSNELKNYKELKTIGDYYESYFGHNNSIKITVLGTQEQGSEASSNSGSSSSSSVQSGSGGEENSSEGNSSEGSSSSGGEKDISNEGKAIIVKGSKQIVELSNEENNNVNLFSKNVKRASFKVENFSDEYFKDANIMFDIRNKVAKSDVYFKDGKPHYDLYLKLFLRTSEISKDELTQQDYEILQMQFSKTLEAKIKEIITNKLKAAEEHFKKYKYDVILCQDKFYKYKTKEYKEYLKTLPKGEEFIESVVFNYSIDIVKSN